MGSRAFQALVMAAAFAQDVLGPPQRRAPINVGRGWREIEAEHELKRKDRSEREEKRRRKAEDKRRRNSYDEL